MAELAVTFGVPIGEMKIGEQTYTLYRLKLIDYAYLEQTYNKPISDILSDPNISRSISIILDVLTLSIRKGDSTVTKEFLGEAIDPGDPEFQRCVQELLPKIFGSEAQGGELKKGGQKNK
jgi:hypothetical protein